MNTIGESVITLCCEYIDYIDIDNFRQCSKYLSIIVGIKYFNTSTYYNFISLTREIIIVNRSKFYNAEFINEKNKHLIRYFIRKYKIQLYVHCIHNYKQLIYFYNFPIEYMYFNTSLKKLLYYDYLLPPKLKKLDIGYIFNQSFNQLPPTLQMLTLSIFLINL